MNLFSGPWLALGNHLWQSTLFAVAIGLLTLQFRNSAARVRYGLWLAASLKFLLPFALLVSLGGALAKPLPAAADSDVYTAVTQVSQPFDDAPISLPMAPVEAPAHVHFATWTPTLLAAVWLLGTLGVAASWWLRWRRVAASLRGAVPLCAGREWQAMQRLQECGELSAKAVLLSTDAAFEPAAFGIVRPVILWPLGISERLDDAHIEAILAHEACHIRRRDNLTAALHMAVQAVFWFHPMVWWLGGRLLDERERACDEEVLARLGRPGVYAEGILKVCQFCLESPLACVAGVTGSDLKARIVRIMAERLGARLGLGRKLGLAALAVAALVGPAVYGLMEVPHVQAEWTQTTGTPRFAFDAVSLKPNKSGDADTTWHTSLEDYKGLNVPLKELIRDAYGLQSPDLVYGLPTWASSARYDVEAKVDGETLAALKAMSPAESAKQQGAMLREMLAERFQLKAHDDTREIPVYALTVAKSGVKMKSSDPNDTYPNGIKGGDGKPAGTDSMNSYNGRMVAQGYSIPNLAVNLARKLHREVVDKTGLTGKYDFTLDYSPDDAPEPGEPSLATALDEELGLKLVSTKGPVATVVVDQIQPLSDGAQAAAPAVKPPAYDAVTIKPHKPGDGTFWVAIDDDIFRGTNVSLRDLIQYAYGLKMTDQIIGGAGWMNSDRYDVQAKIDAETYAAMKGMKEGERDGLARSMMQAMLADRFQLAQHQETKELPIYALTVGRSGPKLKAAASEKDVMMKTGSQSLTATAVDMAGLAGYLSQRTHRMVQDKTGLMGTYDFTLQWAPDEGSNDPGLPSLFTALEEQLGLKLEATKGPVATVVIDKVAIPTED